MAKLNKDFDYVKQWALDHGVDKKEISDDIIQYIGLPGIPFGKATVDVGTYFHEGRSVNVSFFVISIYEEYGSAYSSEKEFIKAFVEEYPFYRFEQPGSNGECVWISIDSEEFNPGTKTQVGGQIALFIRGMKRFLGSKASDVEDYPDGYDYLVGHEIKKAPGRAPKKAKEPSGKGGSDEGSIAVGLLLGLFTSLIGLIVCLIMRKKKTWIGWVIGVVVQFAIIVIIALINSAA